MRVVVLKLQLTLLLVYLPTIVRVDETAGTKPRITTSASKLPNTAITAPKRTTPAIKPPVLTTTAKAKPSKVTPPPKPPNERTTVPAVSNKTSRPDGKTPNANVNFIVPKRISEVAVGFKFKNEEYILVDSEVNRETAALLCKMQYSGILSTVNSMELAKFFSEALSETDLYFDTLWIGGMKSASEEKWKWVDRDVQFNEALFKQLIITNPNVQIENTSLCLAFGRNMHLEPQFRRLSCRARRSFICQKSANGDIEHPESSSDWLKCGSKRFKIYHSLVHWERALAKCKMNNINSTLALVTTRKEAEFLGRYLLIGRPSAENAWIGARWNNEIKGYQFVNKIQLDNSTKPDGYPPWRTKKILKTHGCLLLDRHITNHTVFVETRCERRRPYICSIDDSPDIKIEDNMDFIIKDRGYRLEINEKPWQAAYDFCKAHYGRYGAVLAKVRDNVDFFNLLHCMGEHLTEVQHLWIAGKYINHKWKWMPENKDIPLNTIRLVSNTSYTHDVEKDNICLNMDRENHMTGFHYGTRCSWPQHFICSFTAEKLKQLQRDSKKPKT